jgi:heparosan-N-sulfate-glucuronate 5-epimerase
MIGSFSGINEETILSEQRTRKREHYQKRGDEMKAPILSCFRVFSLITLMLCFLGFWVVYKELQALQDIIKVSPIKMIHANIQGPLSGYYLDLSEEKYMGAKYIFDDKGVPLYTIDSGSYYHTVLISQFALGAYEHYLKTKDTLAKEKFLVCADWLRDHLHQREDFYYWQDPWGRVSAMDQGEGASVLIRAFLTTGDTTYLEMARKAIMPIFYDLSVGGVSVIKGEHYIFPQEYPHEDPPTHVLNGAISAYLGIHDYYRVTNNLDVKTIDDKIVQTFRDTLEQYNTGYWSLYCQCPASPAPGVLASAHYHLTHVQQLRILYSISKDEKFLKFAEKFEQQSQSPMNRVKYVLANHLRQMRNFTLSDIKKIPSKLRDLGVYK